MILHFPDNFLERYRRGCSYDMFSLTLPDNILKCYRRTCNLIAPFVFATTHLSPLSPLLLFLQQPICHLSPMSFKLHFSLTTIFGRLIYKKKLPRPALNPAPCPIPLQSPLAIKHYISKFIPLYYLVTKSISREFNHSTTSHKKMNIHPHTSCYLQCFHCSTCLSVMTRRRLSTWL